MFRGVFKWRQAPVAGAGAKKRLSTKIGRPFHIPDDVSDRFIFNLPVQATRAEGFKPALINIPEKLNGFDARIIHTWHDDIIIEAGEDTADRMQAILEESVEEAFKRNNQSSRLLLNPRLQICGNLKDGFIKNSYPDNLLELEHKHIIYRIFQFS